MTRNMQGSKDMWPATIHFLLIFGLVSPFSSTYRSNSEHWTHPTGTAKPWLVVLFAMFCSFGSYFNWGFAGLHNPLGEGFGEVAPYGFKKFFLLQMRPWCMWKRTMPNFATSDGGVLRLRVAGLLLEALNVGAKSNFISYNLWTISYSWSTVYVFKYDPQ